MSALGQEQTFGEAIRMSALPLKADIEPLDALNVRNATPKRTCSAVAHIVRFYPKADIDPNKNSSASIDYMGPVRKLLTEALLFKLSAEG